MLIMGPVPSPQWMRAVSAASSAIIIVETGISGNVTGGRSSSESNLLTNPSRVPRARTWLTIETGVVRCFPEVALLRPNTGTLMEERRSAAQHQVPQPVLPAFQSLVASSLVPIDLDIDVSQPRARRSWSSVSPSATRASRNRSPWNATKAINVLRRRNGVTLPF